MRKQYSDAFIEQALIKVFSRGENRTPLVADRRSAKVQKPGNKLIYLARQRILVARLTPVAHFATRRIVAC